MEFIPGTSRSPYESGSGQQIWDFLNTPEILGRLETATFLRRPAVEGIEQPLIQQFGDDVLLDPVKQMIGKMVRQILEPRGFVLVKKGVRIRNNILFASGSRYEEGWKEQHEYRKTFEIDGQPFEAILYKSANWSEKYLTGIFTNDENKIPAKWYTSTCPWNVLLDLEKKREFPLTEYLKGEINSAITSYMAQKKREQLLSKRSR